MNKKRAIVVAADYRLMSALVGQQTASALKRGDRVTVVRDLQVDDGAVAAGETACVGMVDESGGYVELVFDNPVPALYAWRNVLILAPFDTPDWIDGLALETCLESKERDGVSWLEVA